MKTSGHVNMWWPEAKRDRGLQLKGDNKKHLQTGPEGHYALKRQTQFHSLTQHCGVSLRALLLIHLGSVACVLLPVPTFKNDPQPQSKQHILILHFLSLLLFMF